MKWQKMRVAIGLFVLGLFAFVPGAQASLTNLVTVGADTVSFDVTTITTIVAGVAAVAIGGAVAVALGIKGAKWIFRVVMGFLGR